MVEFVKPTQELVQQIAADMRPSDAVEVWASHRHTPLEALMYGWSASDFSTVVTHEGAPLAMLGVCKRDILTGSGIVWLLATNEAMKHRREFLRLTHDVLGEMLRICPRLCNFVHTKNRDSIRWLRWMGFIIEDPMPYGPAGELFHRFYLERDGHV